MIFLYNERVKKNIVIIGAGFGGTTAAIALARGIGIYQDEYEIILIDRHRHQLYTPALYEIAAIPASRAPQDLLKSSILIPFADIVEKRAMRIVTDEFVGIKTDEKKIRLAQAGELPYEFLIFALGSETSYFDIPGLAEHSFPLKTFDDAQRLRAALEKIAGERSRARVIVGGAGASGVEVAAEFVNFFCAVQEDNGARKPVCNGEITLVEAGPDILPGFDAWTVRRAKKRLQELGIAVRAGCRIMSVAQNEIRYKDGAASEYDILVWTGGVKGPAILADSGMPLSDKDALLTDEYLCAAGGGNFIFAVGDNAAAANPHAGRMVIWNVPAAEAEARIAAHNILAAIRGQERRKFVPQKKYPFVLALGRKYAIADLSWMRTAGFPGWCLKQLIELRYLLSILRFKKALAIWRLGIKTYGSND
mgnify:CR=1 FL=1